MLILLSRSPNLKSPKHPQSPPPVLLQQSPLAAQQSGAATRSLPADAAIPKTQGQLAELLWQNAGCPQPTIAQATDAAAAARWCVEQGYLEEDFAPEKYVPKYKVIRILKQAKSAT